ncbi:PAS domain S-box protein [Nocardioides marmotae]|uniref:PAS domain S-box protein n=1 Tax=Nocardioides marmotae TaxID=2663857 RepID=UPI0012B5767D|nr:PAS domain S-box protein [Nocardioides marmotae]MBC9732765.1 PAS domain S-box protein [Nocardioides marmotae]MTB83880.1 PAS domain S-box protein [Nocardioides marmotae]
MLESPTIVVVDDAPEVRLLVKTQLRLSGRLEVVGEGADGYDAVELARAHRPALMLLDVSMPGRDGLAALPLVRDASPTTRVVMFSGFDQAGLADHTRRLGAADFVEKSVPLDELVDRLVAIAAPTGTEEPRWTAGAGDETGGGQGRGGNELELDPVLAEHLERFREVFDDAAIGMATMTLDGRVVRVNRHLVGLLGDDADALIGTSYADLATDPTPVLDALQTLRDGGGAVRLEHGLADEPGRRFAATLSAVLDAQDRPLYFLLQAQDVTEQRAAEAELHETEQRFRLLVEAVQDYAIFMLDPEGNVASWNAGAQRLKGYTAEDIVGRNFRIFYPGDKQAERHPEHELAIARREGRYEEEGWRLRKDGTRFWAHVTITAVHDADGVLVGFAKVTRDSTERRRILELQQKANERLRRAAAEQAEFLAVTAHELRSPVGVLAGTAETFARHHAELDDTERTELAEGMRRTADQLRRLLDDLLTASRADARSLGLKVGPIRVEDQLRGVVTSVRSSHPGAQVLLDVEEGLVVLADPGRLAQMVDNLVVNGLTHGRAPVAVVARSEGDAVVISVRDSGPGVSADVRGRLFERFGTTTGGTGLGLYIVRALAQAHGGEATYQVEDQSFVLRLPRDRSA